MVLTPRERELQRVIKEKNKEIAILKRINTNLVKFQLQQHSKVGKLTKHCAAYTGTDYQRLANKYGQT
eukprot:4203874-Pyramimonas_sp.AAC.5